VTANLDNGCGDGVGHPEGFDPTKPPYDPNCGATVIADWLSEPAKTPVERCYGFEGVQDINFGGALFGWEQLQYLGSPVNISTANYPYAGSHRLYAEEGHLDFINIAKYDLPMNLAFAVPDSNRNPTF